MRDLAAGAQTQRMSNEGLVTFSGAVDMTDSTQLLHLLVALRTAMSSSARVSWQVNGEIDAHLGSMLEHLPPPQAGGGASGDRWRSNHTYGALYYRRGPGFIRLRDRRSQYPGAAYTLSGQALECWDILDRPTQHRCDICDVLDSEDLSITIGTFRLALPFRLRYPPTPFLSV